MRVGTWSVETLNDHSAEAFQVVPPEAHSGGDLLTEELDPAAGHVAWGRSVVGNHAVR